MEAVFPFLKKIIEFKYHCIVLTWLNRIMMVNNVSLHHFWIISSFFVLHSEKKRFNSKIHWQGIVWYRFIGRQSNISLSDSGSWSWISLCTVLVTFCRVAQTCIQSKVWDNLKFFYSKDFSLFSFFFKISIIMKRLIFLYLIRRYACLSHTNKKVFTFCWQHLKCDKKL